MKTIKKENKIVFNNDKEFEVFAIIPILKPIYSEKTGTYYADWDFTFAYTDALEKGYTFEIKDPDSQIVKRQAITFKTNTKTVEVKGCLK